MDNDQQEIEEADRRSEKAKASLRQRFSELERRYHSAKQQLDLGARIAEHPRAAVGIAFGVGVLLGLLGRRSAPRVVRIPAGAEDRTLGKAVVAGLGGLAIQALKDLVMTEGAEMAKGWWADRTERDASRDPAVEAFLEH